MQLTQAKSETHNVAMAAAAYGTATTLQRNQSGCHNTGIHHVGLHATNPAASAEFYRDVLGMEIVGGSSPDHPFGATAFLSSRPNEESHEIALFANAAFAHIAFKVSSLAELRALYARVVERNIPIKFSVNHQVSFAFYFNDPDGNMVEVYWPTGHLGLTQLLMEPLDLSQPDGVLLGSVRQDSAARDVAKSSSGAPNEAAGKVPRSFKYVPAGAGPCYWGPGDQITFLITGEETGGAFFMAEVLVPPGGGPPPHTHRFEDESFRLLQGSLTIQIGGKTLNALPGDFVHLPRGITHSFRNNGSVDAKFLLVVTRAGLERFFAESFDPAGDRSEAPPLVTDAMVARLVAAAARYGLEFRPPTLQ
jgi:quercetin dioxygenase-like cupin family protein/catechol 2,3-dioxygenase-like lactoylglutathione lyase family enzyme